MEDYGDVNDWGNRPADAAYYKATSGGPVKVQPDMVQHPPHYTKWAIQPRDFAMANGLKFWQGSALKYIMRAGGKTYDGLSLKESELLDLRKAQEFIEHRIKYVEENK